MSQTKAIQNALLAQGYDLGEYKADGIMGRATIAAIAKFQRDKGLTILYPGTVGPKTLTALGLLGPSSPPVDLVPTWIEEARRYLGMHEKRDNAALQKALRMNPAEIPWCGAFVGMIVSTVLPQEKLPANQLGARNWGKVGFDLPGPQVGAVATFWRGSKSGWSGHTGFVVGHDKTHVHVLGANQSDAVTIARIAKNRLLGYRWFATAGIEPPKTPLAMTTIQASVTTNEA